MLGDASQVDRDRMLECEFCIVGGGPAGITIARELSPSGKDVILLESGGLAVAPATQDLNRGELRGAPQFETDRSRLRMLGGTTGHWAGMCRPLDSFDFAERAWVPLSGWPISREDLDPFYVRAHELCELGPYDYSVERWPEQLRPEPGFEPLDCEFRLLQLSPTRFGERYRRDLEAAVRTKVLLNSTVTEVVTTPDGGVAEHVEVQSLSGGRFQVRAKKFILACGGIENARLLLLSRRHQPDGVGNTEGRVGRYFMDHPAAQPLGTIQSLRQDARRLIQFQPTASGRLMVGLGLGYQTQQAHHLLNSAFYVGSPGNLAESAEASPEVDTMHFLRDTAGAPRVVTATCWLRCEQAPNPESRVMLSEDRDSLDQPRVVLDWRLTELDYESMARSARRYVRALGAANLARIRLEPWLLEKRADWWSKIKAGWHHMGTTRMAETASRGVVDANCRLFGVNNVFVAGSSVFPTSGFANPTLTIVALALRLADHLKGKA